MCLNEDSCESFYMDGGACVFGVSGDVTAFSEGVNTDPDGEQRIQAKSMYSFFLKRSIFVILMCLFERLSYSGIILLK